MSKLQAFKTIPARWGPISVQSIWFMVISALVAVSAITFHDLARRPGTSIWQEFTNGAPSRGELGLGRFTIYGATAAFEYPFRLAHRSIPSIVTPWLGYLLHQSGQFYIIFKARQARYRGELEWTDSSEWNPFAWKMLQLNVVFIAVHYFQTQLFYDALSASFPEMSVLVAIGASFIAVFSFKVIRRGLICNWTPDGAFRELLFEFAGLFKSYHGYFMSFGVICNFWYHPFESTFAHWSGFFHIFLLMWQSSLIYQNGHRNYYWGVVLEMFIWFHATVTAYYQGLLKGGLYLMFMTSFLLIFITGPMWGMPVVEMYLGSKTSLLHRRHYLSLLIPSLVVFLAFSVYMYVSTDRSYLLPMCIAMPVSYYLYMGWFFMFFLAGKKMDKVLVDSWGLDRRGQKWWNVMIFIASFSVALLMFLAEFIYRQFVPYARGDGGLFH